MHCNFSKWLLFESVKFRIDADQLESNFIQIKYLLQKLSFMILSTEEFGENLKCCTTMVSASLIRT